MPQTPRLKALAGLRGAYLRLQLILALSELEPEQEWIARWLKTCERRLKVALRAFDPKTGLPNLLRDTRLGRVIQESGKAQKCKHDWKPCKAAPGLPKARKGKAWSHCKRCGFYLLSSPTS
jgi:hypothetical protein